MTSSNVYSTMTFTNLYPDLRAVCTPLARRIVGDYALADQIAAEALLRLYGRWEEINDSSGHRRAWALRVTRNLAIDEIRLQRRHQPLINADLEVLDATSEVLLRMVLRDALADLSEGQRRSVALRYLRDLSQAAAAEALGVEPGTIATHTSRAFAQLRKRLADEAPAPSTGLIQEKPTMKITSLEQAKQLIGTNHTVAAQVLDRLDKDKIQADIGIPAVYRRRGQMPITATDRPVLGRLHRHRHVRRSTSTDHRLMRTRRRSTRPIRQTSDPLRQNTDRSSHEPTAATPRTGPLHPKPGHPPTPHAPRPTADRQPTTQPEPIPAS